MSIPKIGQLGIVLFMVLGGGCARQPAGLEPPATSGRHAIFLTNNQVVFGKLSGFGTPWPVVEDVYYVRTNVNQATKEVANVLVKRGNEWHSPDRMVINASHILFVEPVGSGSRVIELIKGMASGSSPAQ
jgi:hypothetical protein